MNKKELIRRTAKATGKTQKECTELLNVMLEITAKELCEGGDLLLTGFGSLRIKERAPRMGVHPATGEAVEIPGGKTVTFRPSDELKAMLDCTPTDEDGE
jgi:DNA-binding protein HU-beta